jgi:hypothetical protein
MFKISLFSQLQTAFCGGFFHFCLDTKVEQKIKPARLTPVGRGCIKKPKNRILGLKKNKLNQQYETKLQCDLQAKYIAKLQYHFFPFAPSASIFLTAFL